MNELLIEFMRSTELDDDLLWKKAAEHQEIFVRDKIGMHLTKSPIFVVSTHMSKSCLLPVYAFKLSNGIEFIMRENFYGWVISIRSPFTIEKLPSFCHGDGGSEKNYAGDISDCYCEGFHDSWVYAFANENFKYSTFRVYDDYDLYTLIYLLNGLNNVEKEEEKRYGTDTIKAIITNILSNHKECDSIYDVFKHTFFKATDYSFCKKNGIEDVYILGKAEEENIKALAERISNNQELHNIFMDEVDKIQWGENFS